MIRPVALRVLLAAVVAAAAGSGCGTFKGGVESFNAPPVYEGPGCYDNKGRLDRTIAQPVECQRQSFVWKTAP